VWSFTTVFPRESVILISGGMPRADERALDMAEESPSLGF